jgi:hypothetical protein
MEVNRNWWLTSSTETPARACRRSNRTELCFCGARIRSGPRRPTVALQHVGSYLGWTSRCANAFGGPARDLERKSQRCDHSEFCKAHSPLTAAQRNARESSMRTLKTCGHDRVQQHRVAIINILPRHAHAQNHQFSRGDYCQQLAEMPMQHECIGGEIKSLAPGQPNLAATVDRAPAFIGRRIRRVHVIDKTRRQELLAVPNAAQPAKIRRSAFALGICLGRDVRYGPLKPA